MPQGMIDSQSVPFLMVRQGREHEGALVLFRLCSARAHELVYCECWGLLGLQVRGSGVSKMELTLFLRQGKNSMRKRECMVR